MPTPYVPQRFEGTFTMPDGSESAPVVVVQEDGESIAALRNRFNAAMIAAWEAVYG